MPLIICSLILAFLSVILACFVVSPFKTSDLALRLLDSVRLSRSSRVLVVLAVVLTGFSSQLDARHGGSVGSGRGYRQSKVKTRNTRRSQSSNPVNPFKFRSGKAKYPVFRHKK